MVLQIKIHVVDNGYIVDKYDNATSEPIKKIYKNTEEFQLLEDIGKALLNKKVKVEER